MIKIFFVTLAAAAFLIGNFLLFGGSVLMKHSWVILLLISLPVAVIVTLCVHFDNKITELQKRIEIMEAQNNNENQT